MAAAATTNMYRVGDYVYFEINSSAPYQIRRIEELNKTPNGNVEAKVMCFYRRRDVSSTLTKIFDERPSTVSSSKEVAVNGESSTSEEDKAMAKEEKMETEELADDHQASSSPKNLVVVTEGTSEEQPSAQLNGNEVTAAVIAADAESTVGVEPLKASAAPTPTPSTTGNAVTPKTSVRMPGEEHLSDSERHRLLHHELFLSRQIETLPATHIRGKCSVTLLNEIETPDSYLGHDDMFFYSLVYDPTQKTLIADKGEIRIGEKYQADVPDMFSSEEEKENYMKGFHLETPIYHPYHNLTDRQIDQFIIVARAVGTFARALDMSSSAKQPNLHLTAAAASRDVTPFQALTLLHYAEYDLSRAMCYLVPPAQKQSYPLDADKATSLHTATLGGPLMCRDQLEEWSAAEANLFDEALERYGKDFNGIRQDFLPWKALRDIVEYYYMWKTTDRYVQQKRVKAGEAESRLKQVYIPTYSKPNPNAWSANSAAVLAQSAKPCEGCSAENSDQWYSWGPAGSLLRLCRECWIYWKKFGGLKRSHTLENFDKTAYQAAEHITGTVPRPSDRLESFDASIRRCTIGGCGRQFFSIQLLNQHMRRDHFVGSDLRGSPSVVGGGLQATTLAAAQPGSVAATVAAAQQGAFYGQGCEKIDNDWFLGRGFTPRTRTSFFIHTTLMTKVARRLAPKSLLNVRRSARNPFSPINLLAIKQHCQAQPPHIVRSAINLFIKGGVVAPLAQHVSPQQPKNVCGTQQTGRQGPRPIAPKPPPSAAPNIIIAAPMPSALPQKRAQNGCSWNVAASPAKKLKTTEIEKGDALLLKWIRTADDCYFHATKRTKTLKRDIRLADVRKAGRCPYKTPNFVQNILARLCEPTA